MSGLSFSYFIYYRVAEPARAQAVVRHMQADVKSRTGVDGRLLQKRDDPQMCMEIYERVGNFRVFEDCLSAALQAADFAAVLKPGGERHVECFEEPCA
jgi:hypothetical protein